MISRSSLFAFICLLLVSSHLFAKSESIPNAICKNISEHKKPSVFLLHRGQLLEEKQPVDLGELESRSGENELPSSGSSYLISNTTKYTISASKGNALRVELAEVPASCKKTKQYEIRWVLYPKNFGHGKFEEQFALYFDGPSDFGYSPQVSTIFNTSVVGIIHGSESTVDLDKGDAKKFFLGARNSISLFVRNAGDRDLLLDNLTSDMPENPKEIKLLHSDCPKKIITPSSSCVIELELRSRLPKSASPFSYAVAFNSNEVGAKSTVIYLEYDERFGVRTYVKRWE